MTTTALVLVFFTVAIGAMTLWFWSGDRVARTVVSVHVVFAAATVATLIAFLIGRSSGVGWSAVAVLGCTGLLGLTTWRRSHASVPAVVLAVHGGFALAALAATLAAVSR